MLCEQIPELEVVKAFNNPEVMLKECENIAFDLCILDIEMPGLNGLEVARLLNGKPVIFTTAYKEYAINAFDLNAIDYIQKPIQKERLEISIKKAIQRFSKTTAPKDFISINSNKGRILLYFNELIYLTISESDSRDKIAFLENGSQLILKNSSFEKLLAVLPSHLFCRINKKDVISLKSIQHYTLNEITLTVQKNQKPIFLSLSEVYRTEFIKRVE